jgi:riboflavin kinase/FMN adenylyltransferase
MKVWSGIENRPRDDRPVVATLGNYDGIHLGHRRILDSVLADARERGAPSLVITFEPHPLSVVAPERAPSLVMTRRQKIDTLESLGLDAMLILRFDARVAALSGEEFFAAILDRSLRFAAVHVGGNFHFGRGRSGDLALLEQIGRHNGFDVVGIPPVTIGDTIVSSTEVRAAIEAGEVERAWRFLGRPFEIHGEVGRGDGRGRTIGFPTANLIADNETLPKNGVYVTETARQAARYASVTNVGVRPTFNGSQRVVETHLFDLDDDLYGERISLRFLARLRDEQRFGSAAELADQIARDKAAAVAFFDNQNIQAQ